MFGCDSYTVFITNTAAVLATAPIIVSRKPTVYLTVCAVLVIK